MTLALPARIGGYRLERELGRGATGTVYLAWDTFREREVAIKLADPALIADPVRGARLRHFLENEARLAGQLRHPHIAAVLDAQLDGPQPYIVTEYVAGTSLQAYTRPETLLPVREVIDLLFKCCNALDYAQRLGLIHRDIKPANLLRPESGGVKLTDFGAAVAYRAEHTQIVGLVGSPAYMSPEQVREVPLTHQSDMFSLGVVAYELLSGHRPFEGDTDFATIYKINCQPHVPLREYRPDLPPALEAVMARVLAKTPEARYPTWVDFAEALLDLTQVLPKVETRPADASLFKALRRMDFFSAFPDSALWETIHLGKVYRVSRGGTLMQQDAPASSFYVLVEGVVGVLRDGLEVARQGAGVTLGEMAYLRTEAPRRSATIVAHSDLVVLKIPNAALRAAPASLQGQFDRAFIRLLVDRLDQVNRQLVDLDFKP